MALGLDRDCLGRAEEVARKVYAGLLQEGTPLCWVTDLATAELVRTAANAFLATDISSIDAMPDVCGRRWRCDGSRRRSRPRRSATGNSPLRHQMRHHEDYGVTKGTEY